MRTFVFHREDGQDGLPGNNIVSFMKRAETGALTDKTTGISHSLSSIPLDGNRRTDVAGLATELCQSEMLAADDLKAEMTCNSFGLAVECAYSDMNYKQYLSMVEQIAYVAPDKDLQFKAKPISREAYGKLTKDLAKKPDILTPNEG